MTYAREWITSESPPPDDLIAYVREGIEREGNVIVGQQVVQATDEAHWLLNCESVFPHSHIWIKWSPIDA